MHGENLNNLNDDDQQTLNAFRKASAEAATLREQSATPPNTNPPDAFYHTEVENLAKKLLNAVRAEL